MKLLCVGLLVIVLIYCCLGTIGINEGLTNSASNQGLLGPGGIQKNTVQPTSSYDPAKAVAEAGRQHARQEGKEYQQDIADQCPGGMDEHGY